MRTSKNRKKSLEKKDDTQDLSAAVIRSYKDAANTLQKKNLSDTNLTESLNRYISTLETKINYQTELIQELRERLDTLLAAYFNKK